MDINRDLVIASWEGDLNTQISLARAYLYNLPVLVE